MKLLTDHLGLIDPQALVSGAGVWGLIAVCAVVFAETGLLAGFFLPGDTLLFFTGVLTLSGGITQPLWLVLVAVAAAAALGDQVGFEIGRRTGPRIFDRRESGFFSRASVTRTRSFFDRFGPAAVTVARFVPVVRTFTPVAAGVGRMPHRVFTSFNVLGATVWACTMVLVGFALAHLPGVAVFVSSYLDLLLIGVAVISLVPVLARMIILRRRRRVALSDTASAPKELSGRRAGSDGVLVGTSGSENAE